MLTTYKSQSADFRIAEGKPQEKLLLISKFTDFAILNYVDEISNGVGSRYVPFKYVIEADGLHLFQPNLETLAAAIDLKLIRGQVSRNNWR